MNKYSYSVASVEKVMRIIEILAADDQGLKDVYKRQGLICYNMYIKYCFVFINFNININVFPPFNAEGHCFAEDV